MAQQSDLSSAGALNLNATYPKQIGLPDGQQLILRLMRPTDRDQVLRFACSLPPDDLLFLRTDITEPEIVDAWIAALHAGTTITVLADAGEELAGYASLHLEQARWTRRVGEIRVQVASAFRGLGLGRHLTAEIFHLGQARGLKKMAAMMTPDQTGAHTAFEKLGFQVEALLQDWVEDRSGRSRDLLVMSYDLERPNERTAAETG
jgi:L-amino acid N-acyltransferase YncA